MDKIEKDRLNTQRTSKNLNVKS